MEKYEYKTMFFDIDLRSRTTEDFQNEVNVEFQKELNELGLQGWELISTVTFAASGMGSNIVAYITSIFKRKIK